MKKTYIAVFAALAAMTAAAEGAAAMDRILVGDAAARCDWELMPFETVDGIKGRMAHVVRTAKPGLKVEIPLRAKGRHRIWIGAVAKRWGSYTMFVKLARERYPVRMLVDFQIDDVPPENPMIGELELGVFDLDDDTLVVANDSGYPGGIAWVRLEPVSEPPAVPEKGIGMVATNDSFWHYLDRDEYFSHFRFFAGSPVKKILFGAVTGENALPVRIASAVNAEYDPSFPYPSDVHERIMKACARLAAENPRLLEETAEYVHSLGMEIHAYFRPGAAVNLFRFWSAEGDAERGGAGKGVMYAPENLCRLWDGTAVGRPSYARRDVRDFVLRNCAEILGRGFDGISFAFTRALPATLFEPAFRERFKLEYGEELKDKDDPRVIELRCAITGEFLAEVKKLLGRRGLSLIVLGSVERNREFGVDVAALAKAGTVDEFIVDGEDFRLPRKITVEKMDFESFRRATEGTKARVRPQFTHWWDGLSPENFRKAVDAGLAPACLWDGSFSPWQDWERIRRIDGGDLSAAERWATEHPDSWRVHRLKTLNNFDVLEHPWWLAF